MAIRGKIFVALLLAIALVALTPAFAAEKQSMGDAWWTGPLQTPNAGTLPVNHWYVETYFAVEQDNGGYNNSGTKFGANNKYVGSGYDNDFQSTTLFSYGVLKNFTSQILLGLDGAQGGSAYLGQTNGKAPNASSNGLEVNTARFREVIKLHSYKQGQLWPTFSIVPEVNAPVASGAIWTPGVGFWAIRPFWMPNGRILRIRASEDLWFPKSGKTEATGGSQLSTACLGTTATCSFDAARYSQTQVGFEYSLTKKWVPAWDFVYKYYGLNKFNGADATSNIVNPATGVVTAANATLQGRYDFRIDPALEYNFTENTGIIFGVEVTVAGRNTGSYIAPQIALQWFK
jgi:hypothetical protein